MVFDVDAGASLPGPEWLVNLRARASADLRNLTPPTSAEEMWRYSRINDLDLDSYAPAESSDSGDVADDFARLLPDTPAALTVVTRNGRVVRMDVGANGDAAKVKVLNAAADDGEQRFGAASDSGDYFERLNAALTPDPVTIEIAAGAVVTDPIVILHVAGPDGTASFPRLVVRAGEQSQVAVCEYFVSGASDDTLVVPVTEFDISASANVDYLTVQALGDKARQIAYQMSSVERDATFRSSAVALGGSYARVRTDSRLTGKGASSRLDAVYFGLNDQMHDFRTVQDHRAPKTTSELLFKGVVGGKSHSVYSGLIRVEKGAAGTNAFQTNRNLVLSDGARADSVPNLEIEENDVKCSHASAVGPVDEEQKYYLESRGIPGDVAERLIVSGFLAEMLTRIPVVAARAPLKREVDTRFARLYAGVAR